MSASVSMPRVFTPSMTPRIPRPCSDSATITSTGFAVAQKTWQTSGTLFTVFRILMGNPPSMKMMKAWPQERARAFFCASSMSLGSFPAKRTSAGPDDSLKPTANFIWGAVCTMASYRSSTVLMKCDWPRMKFMSAGFSILTVLSSMYDSLRSLANPLETVGTNGKDSVIVPLQFKVHSVSLVHPCAIEPLPVLLDDFDAEGGMAHIFTDQPKCFDEFGL